jgi:hypothetical protein
VSLNDWTAILAAATVILAGGTVFLALQTRNMARTANASLVAVLGGLDVTKTAAAGVSDSVDKLTRAVERSRSGSSSESSGRDSE